MKTTLMLSVLALTTGHLIAAALQDEVAAAAKKLGEQASYSWKQTVTVPEGSQFRPGPTEGKTDKGLTHVTMTFGENKTEMVIKGDKGAVLTREGEWKSSAELESAEGQGRFLSAMTRNYQLPSTQAAEIAGWVKEMKKDGEVYIGALSEDGVKALISFRRRAGAQAPTVGEPSGTVKFWVKDGVLTKYEYFVKGKMAGRDGNERTIERTTTVEIKDAGKTTVTIPEEAKKKLS
jgi:hypothetical protein